MANPEAVMRAAQAGPKPPMGGMPDAPPAGAPPGAPPAGPKPPEAGGMDSMVSNLEGVGKFLQAQGPKAQEAMGHFQALLQSMASLGEEGGQPPSPEEPKESGRMDMNRLPGTQVL